MLVYSLVTSRSFPESMLDGSYPGYRPARTKRSVLWVWSRARGSQEER